MGDESTQYLITINADGGIEAARQLQGVADAEDEIADGHKGMGDELGKGLETGGIHLLGHEILAANGAMGASRAMMPLMRMAAMELNATMGALAGPIGAIVVGAGILGVSLYHLIEAHHAHKEALESVTSEIEKQNKEMEEMADNYNPANQAIKQHNQVLVDTIHSYEEMRDKEKAHIDGLKNDIALEKESSAYVNETAEAHRGAVNTVKALTDEIAQEDVKLKVLNVTLEKQSELLKKKMESPKAGTEDKSQSDTLAAQATEQEKSIAENRQYINELVKDSEEGYDQQLADIKKAESEIEALLRTGVENRLLTQKQADARIITEQATTQETLQMLRKKENEDWINIAYTGSKEVATLLGQSLAGQQVSVAESTKKIFDLVIDAEEKKVEAIGLGESLIGAMMGDTVKLAAVTTAMAELTGLEAIRAVGDKMLSGAGASGGSGSGGVSSGVSGSSTGGAVSAQAPGGSTVSTAPTTVNITINAGMMFTPDQATLTACMQNFWTQSVIMMKQGQIPQVEFA